MMILSHMKQYPIYRDELIEVVETALTAAHFQKAGTRRKIRNTAENIKQVLFGENDAVVEFHPALAAQGASCDIMAKTPCGCPLVEAFGTITPGYSADDDFLLESDWSSDIFVHTYDTIVSRILMNREGITPGTGALCVVETDEEFAEALEEATT